MKRKKLTSLFGESALFASTIKCVFYSKNFPSHVNQNCLLNNFATKFCKFKFSNKILSSVSCQSEIFASEKQVKRHTHGTWWNRSNSHPRRKWDAKKKKFHLQNIDYRFILKNSFRISLHFHKCSLLLLLPVTHHKKLYEKSFTMNARWCRRIWKV